MALIAGVQYGTPITSTTYTGIPAGTILPCGSTGALTRTLLCDGTSYLRADYPALFAVIGTAFGSVDGNSFNVPDTRGIFLRGAGTNPSNSFNTTTLGNRQVDQFKSHAHATDTYWDTNNFDAQSGTGGGKRMVYSRSGTNAAGDTETRPANLGINYCIAY